MEKNISLGNVYMLKDKSVETELYDTVILAQFHKEGVFNT